MYFNHCIISECKLILGTNNNTAAISVVFLMSIPEFVDEVPGGGGEAGATTQRPAPERAPLCIAHRWMVPRKMEFVLSLKCSQNSNSETASPFFPGAYALGDKTDWLTSEGLRKWRNVNASPRIGPHKRKNIKMLPPTIRWILTNTPLTSDKAGPRGGRGGRIFSKLELDS